MDKLHNAGNVSILVDSLQAKCHFLPSIVTAIASIETKIITDSGLSVSEIILYHFIHNSLFLHKRLFSTFIITYVS